MNDPIILPSYPDEELAELSPAKLTDILIEDQDCVPRNVIDACVRCGEAMTEYLRQLHEDDFLWIECEDELDEIAEGIWWLRLHATMILGKIPSEQAGLLLVELMRRMSQEEDGHLQDWLSGYWPALFQNKPDTVIPFLRALCEDKSLDWYIRATAIEAVIGFASNQGTPELEQALAWLAGIVTDESDN
jgi:HEAT repeat protein